MNTFIRILFAVIYTVVYVYLAIDNAGAGHGTFLFFLPLFTWMLILAAFFSLLKSSGRAVLYIFVILMVLHYAMTIFLVFEYVMKEKDGVFIGHWNKFPYFVSFTVLWYLLGQLVIWTAFCRRKPRPSPLP